MSLDETPAPVKSPAIEAFLAERNRQVIVLGHTEEDDFQREDELARAGACYIDWAVSQLEGSATDEPHPFWPWLAHEWKPNHDNPWRTIEKGVALVAAGYDEMMREETS